MTSAAIEAVVFDLDEVLTHYTLPRRLAYLSNLCGMPPQDIRAAIFESGFEDASERGEWSADEYLREFGARMGGYPLTAEQWVEARRAAMEPNEPVLAIAQGLGERLPVALFTNNGFLLKRHFAEVYPAAAELFGERATFSADVGHAKPSPEAFRRLAARLGHAPDRIVFFDDTASYIEGAREAGLHAYQYTGVDAMVARLEEHSLGPIARV
jgi:putative hydrolase of the HAD superfamily